MITISEITQSEHVSPFEQAKRVDENGDWWSARDLAKILGYAEYRNFVPVIEKARVAGTNSGAPTDQFVEMHEMVSIGSGAMRELPTVRLTRYACYLIIQNADPAKEVVALGQSYFAIQTHKQEQMEREDEDERRVMLRGELRRHNSALADAAKEVGVVSRLDFAIFQNEGYKGLYGGLGTKEIQQRKGLNVKRQPLLDHVGSEELAANLFRATQAEAKLQRDMVFGKDNANRVHRQVGEQVRKAIAELGGTMPENLPAVDHIRNAERRLKTQQQIADGDDVE